ncbi:MAG: PKD domain-containing protein [Saprospiraceae bacterium]|nr:PKD domain-containing protein [Saprospiraceae bacterium]
MSFRISNIIFIVIGLNIFPVYLSAQNNQSCGQALVTENWFKQRPELKADYEANLKKIAEARTKIRSKKNIHTRSNILYQIPVVFHILHLGGAENISDEQINDQVRILNRDYQKQNADTSKVVPQFKNNIGDVGFEFRLANIDPDGNCTNGIVRHYTYKTNWDAYNLKDFTFSWPTNKYLNIYVVKKINIAPAYTFLPGTPIPDYADAIVCESNLVGSIGTASIANSRVLTHEVGHWFGLPHIWGVSNAPGVECGDDFVDDTPITKGFTSCSVNNAKICDPAIHENVQNYMDYTPCKIMFTIGQAEYMHETILLGINGRDFLISENNLLASGISGNEPCKTYADFYITHSSVCTGGSVSFFNQSNPGSNDAIYIWDVNGGIPVISNDSMIEVIFPEAGTFEVKLIVSGSNGRDSVFKTIEVFDGANGKKPSHLYSFEASSFPSDIRIVNQDSDDIFWEINAELGANNTIGCIYLNNVNTSETAGNKDYFETQFFDLSEVNKPQFSFFYAYAKKYENQADSFKVEYTFNCGESWKSLPGIPIPSIMANFTGGTNETPFIPETPDKWRKLSLISSIQAILKNKPSVKFRFYFKSDPNVMGSNNLYIDEINISGEAVSSLEKVDESEIIIYPNPSITDINIEIKSIDAIQYKLKLQNVTGTYSRTLDAISTDGQSIRYIINHDNSLTPGLYYLHIKKEGFADLVKKIVIL